MFFKRFFAAALALHSTLFICNAQHYSVTTRARDSFSLAYTSLVNAAPNRFSDLKGEMIQQSWLGNDHRLRTAIPGATLAIVRERDWDINVYIEYGGYRTSTERDTAILRFIENLRKAWGDQLSADLDEKGKPIYAFSIKDTKGYFASSMEILPGSTSAPVYLLAPDNATGKDNYFFLFKMYSGKPAYYFQNVSISTPDPNLDKTLRALISDASEDFEKWKQDSVHGKQKHNRKVEIDGTLVILNFLGEHHYAEMRFTIDSLKMPGLCRKFHDAIQAATGTQYVYRLVHSQHPNEQTLYFLPGKYSPRIWLECKRHGTSQPFITIRIESPHWHSVKRGLLPGEW